MLLKFLLIILVVTFSFELIGQNTNVIIPKAKIYNKNLTNLYFQNGEKILFIYENNENYRELWSKSSNQPIVLITLNNEYLYNYKAVNDPRNICFENSRVLTKTDLIDVKGQYSIYESEGKSQELLIFNKTEMLNNNSDCDNLNKYDVEFSNENYIALNGLLATNSDNQKFIPVVGYNKDAKNSLIFSSQIYNQGIPIRCIESLNYSDYFSSKTHSYEQLVPNEFNNLKSKIIANISNPFILKENQIFTYNGELVFNSEGINESRISAQSKKETIEIENNLNYVLKRFNVFPFYENIKIKSTAPINVKLERFEDEISEYIYLTKRIIELKLENLNEYNLFKDVMNLADKGFEFNYKTVNYRIEFNGYLENEPKTNLLNKVKGKGPVYSFLCVVPGLGQLKIQQQDGYRKLRLWHFSAPVGAIAIASKIYSNYYYSKFLSDLDGSNSRKYYKQANFSQKVFMSSLIAYSAMSLVDFTLTFGIGCKNKALQYSVNQKIRKTL